MAASAASFVALTVNLQYSLKNDISVNAILKVEVMCRVH